VLIFDCYIGGIFRLAEARKPEQDKKNQCFDNQEKQKSNHEDTDSDGSILFTLNKMLINY